MPIRHKTVKHRRIHTVIERLMLIAGHLTVHSRKVFWRLDAAVRGHILSLEYLGRWQRFDLYSRLWTLLCCALFYCFLVVFSYFIPIPQNSKKNRQGNGFIIKKNDKKYCKFFFTHLVKKKTSVKKVNFRITKPFSQLKSISALILPSIETVIGNNLSFKP